MPKQSAPWKPWNRNMKQTTAFGRTASPIDRAAMAAKAPFVKVSFEHAATQCLPLLYGSRPIDLEKPGCYICDREANSVDHLRSLETYGDLIHNRAPICNRCNNLKGSKDLLEFLEPVFFATLNIQLPDGDDIHALHERARRYADKLEQERQSFVPRSDAVSKTVDKLLESCRAAEHAHRMAIDVVLGHTPLEQARTMLRARCANTRTRAIEATEAMATFERLVERYSLARALS